MKVKFVEQKGEMILLLLKKIDSEKYTKFNLYQEFKLYEPDKFNR